MRLLRLFFVLLPGLAFAADPPAHPYADPVRRRIATAQDERNTALLIPFLTDKNPTYRAAAAEALASVQDRTAVFELLPLLRDATPAVRRAAAYALGQAGDSAAVPGLSEHLMQPESSALVRRAAYEALGRCVTKSTVGLLWDIRPPGPDSAAAPGRAWAIYRASLRGLATAEAVQEATKLLDQAKQVLPARQGASAALTRMRGQDSTLARVALPVLLKSLSADPDYFVRANCATALGRVARPMVYKVLAKKVITDGDHRVRIAAMRALPGALLFPVAMLPSAAPPIIYKHKELLEKDGFTLKPVAVLWQAIDRPLAQEALTAAEWFLKPKDGAELVPDLLTMTRNTRHYRARATLFQAALRHAPAAQRSVIADTIRRRYRRTTNQYEKAALLTALSEDPAQFDFLATEALQATSLPVVPGTALTALVALRGNKDFLATSPSRFYRDAAPRADPRRRGPAQHRCRGLCRPQAGARSPARRPRCPAPSPR